jgi:predicted ArsR family transcriptional regulator
VTAMPSNDPLGRRHEVLQILRASPDPMNIVAIAEEVNLHPNSVRYHLINLVDAGLAEQAESGHKALGRPALTFRAVRRMDRNGTRHYRVLADVLITALAADRRPRAKALAAGRAWGHSLANLESELESPPAATSTDEAIDRLVDVLDELGFAPERRATNGGQDHDQQVGHRHCPFLELAENHTNVACPVHLGIIRGVLEARGTPITAERLDAFVAPDLCVLSLKSTSVNE